MCDIHNSILNLIVEADLALLKSWQNDNVSWLDNPISLPDGLNKLSQYSDIIWENYDWIKLLNIACREGSIKFVKVLLSQGVPVNIIQPNTRYSALFVATHRKHIDIVNLLTSTGAQLATSDSEYERNKVFLTHQGLLRFKRMYSSGPMSSDDLLLLACDKGRLDIVKTLVEEFGTSVRNDRGYDGFHDISYNPLARACQYYFYFHQDKREHVNIGNFELVRYLVERGADVRKDAPHTYITADAPELLQYLLNNGADINAFGNGPNVPGMLEASIGGGCINNLKCLLDWGVDVNAPGVYDHPLDLFKCYLFYNDSDETENTLRTGLQILRMLLDDGAHVNATDSAGNTLLMQLVFGHERGLKYADIVTLLLEYDAAIDIVNNEGECITNWTGNRNSELVSLCRNYGLVPICK